MLLIFVMRPYQAVQYLPVSRYGVLRFDNKRAILRPTFFLFETVVCRSVSFLLLKVLTAAEDTFTVSKLICLVAKAQALRLDHCLGECSRRKSGFNGLAGTGSSDGCNFRIKDEHFISTQHNR